MVAKNYPIEKNEVDDSKDILKEIRKLVDLSVEFDEQANTISQEPEVTPNDADELLNEAVVDVLVIASESESDGDGE